MAMNQTYPELELLNEIVALAEKAGAAIMEIYARADVGTTYKEDNSPLTLADLAAHHILLEGLPVLTPDIPVISEESASVPYEVRQSWKDFYLVDPLDGTKEFLKKSGEFTVNVAWIQDHLPVLGVVHAPALEVTYYAAKGIGAFKKVQGRVTPVQAADYHQEGLRVAASRSHGREALEPFLNAVNPTDCIDVGSSLKFCLVAEGKAHLYPRFGPTMEWDTAAGQCVVAVAGGSVTDLNGKPLRYNKPDLRNPYFMACGKPAFPWAGYIHNDAIKEE